MDISDILQIGPYSLKRKEKGELLNKALLGLTQHHYLSCLPYRRMLDGLGFDASKAHSFKDLPFLPVSLFKLNDLLSVPKEEIVKTMTSSGTTGQAVSKIYLDKATSANQTKVLTKIVSSFIGKQRLPMIIIDTEAVIKNRNLFSARGAGILGFSMFGSQRVFALTEQMKLDFDELLKFIKKHEGKRIFVFGFTFMIYQHFYKELVKNNIRIDLSEAVLFHGGGWKKLKSKESPEGFKKRLNDACGITKVHDYYGMVEQTGTIYVECEQGYLHAPIYADIIIRNPQDFSVSPVGARGIIQVVSILPRSYPGHSLLTEDEGVLIGEDSCLCGRKGKYFKIIGRIKNAELRGCSDTYAEQF